MRQILLTLIAGLTLSLAGCAGTPDNLVSDSRDPYEATNRKIYAFNMGVDDLVLEPAAKGYRKLPSPVRTGLTNHVTWTSYPGTAVNSALQGKVENAALATIHFLMNSLTLGFVDLVEDDEPEREDFGQTLAFWSAPEGPYIMAPLFGPGTVRSHTGLIVDILTNPLGQLGEPALETVQLIGAPAGAVTFRGNNFDQINEVKYNALDPYAKTRSIFLQFREGQINDGDTSAPSAADTEFDQFFSDQKE
ncbi:VacJ family lipoprotein [Alphaproteobacteria bacterium LSUCC0684]